MKVVLYARESLSQFRALAEGCQRVGHTPFWQRPQHFKPNELVTDAGAVVIHGIQQDRQKIVDLYNKRGAPVWIMELPRLRDEKDAHGFYLNTVHWIPEKGYRKPVANGVIKDRKPETVLVCGQVPDDYAHGLPANEWNRWSRETVALAREKTGLPVTYRKHPMNGGALPPDGYGADQISEEATIYEAMRNAALVVCHNSTVGWNAIDAGVPVVYTATGKNEPGWKEYASPAIEHAFPLSAKKRTEALSRVASAQWTLDEMRDGTTALRCFGDTRMAA